MDKLLYYPTISIPDSSWLPKALLYWDGVATIAPIEYLQDPNRFSDLTRSLLQEGFLEVVPPEEYVDAYSDDYAAFLHWARRNEDYFSLKTPFRSGRTSLIPYDLHMGKLGSLGSELVRAGLARHTETEWFLVNQRLGEAFMTFLAVLIGQDTERDPVTDRFEHVSSLFFSDKRMASKCSNAVRNTLRDSILNEILPVPRGLDGMEGLRKVCRFKERHHDELERFRRHIEDFILAVDGLPETVQEERRRIFLTDVQEEIEELKGHMGWFRAPQIDLGTFIAAAPCAFSALSGDYAGATVGIAALVGETIYNRERGHNRRKPLAYAALYQGRYGNRQSKRSTAQ